MEKKQPIAVELKKGEKYFWCACGKSSKLPFCDFQAHKGTGFAPKQFTAEKDGTVHLCTCTKTKNPPYCDGSHNEE